MKSGNIFVKIEYIYPKMAKASSLTLRSFTASSFLPPQVPHQVLIHAFIWK